MFNFLIFTGEAITKMMGAVTDIVGRAKQAYVVGQGLSQEGAKLLGAKLANMTIGDLESMLDTKNIDPFLVVKLMNELKDLAKALVSIQLIVCCFINLKTKKSVRKYMLYGSLIKDI